MDSASLGTWVQHLGWFIILIFVVLNFIVNARRRPSIESEFATKQELYRVEGQLLSRMDKTDGRVEANQRSTDAMFHSIMRALGGVERAVKDSTP